MGEDRITILHIDDEPEMLDLVQLILRRKNYEYVGASGGLEGLRLALELKPDLILLDLMMPDLHGWDVYQRIRANEDTRNTPVIVVTAKAENIDWALGMKVARVNDYVTKPFNAKQLIESVESVLLKVEASNAPIS